MGRPHIDYRLPTVCRLPTHYLCHMLCTIEILIKGKVQGVFFRQSAKDKARDLELTGTAKNLPDGSVHIIATGKKEQLDRFVSWCHEGPPSATVTGVSIAEINLQAFDQFNIKRF
jgi:acylphosphatase